jgi:hypothetical protein
MVTLPAGTLVAALTPNARLRRDSGSACAELRSNDEEQRHE